MQIISHRGYWQRPEEKNSSLAFARSFGMGFGTETDVRDFDGRLVISHDPPSRDVLDFGDFLALYGRLGLPLALNIKADGLATLVKSVAMSHGLGNYFAFDMSIPDMRHYRHAGVPFYTRLSEYERQPVFLEHAAGVWLDAFESTWFTRDTIQELLGRNRGVCVVSSELHGRDHIQLWSLLRPLKNQHRMMLCTDLPEEARHYFGANP